LGLGVCAGDVGGELVGLASAACIRSRQYRRYLWNVCDFAENGEELWCYAECCYGVLDLGEFRGDRRNVGWFNKLQDMFNVFLRRGGVERAADPLLAIIF
jgi:hypothetical protein